MQDITLNPLQTLQYYYRMLLRNEAHQSWPDNHSYRYIDSINTGDSFGESGKIS